MIFRQWFNLCGWIPSIMKLPGGGIIGIIVFIAIAAITGGRGLWLGSLFYGSGGRRWGSGRSGGGGAKGRY